MASRNQAANKLADLILELVIKNDMIDSATVEHYRRIINAGTGTPDVVEAVGLNLQNILLYGNDYRQSGFAKDFYEKIDMVVDSCLADVNVAGGYRIPSMDGLSFNPPIDPDNAFAGNDASFAENAWIEFSNGNENNVNYPPFPLCTDANAAIYIPPLLLTQDVLGFLSQFVPFDNRKRNIDLDLAKEVLDTNIYELIPGKMTRQERIDRLFSEFTDLLGPSPVEDGTHGFDLDVTQDSESDTWLDLTDGQENWHNLYGINPIVNPDIGNIVRLERDTSVGKEGQSLETMRNVISDYLKDLDFAMTGMSEDVRPERETQGQGYLQIRHMNQAIIIRNEEDKELGIVGDDEYNPDWLTQGFTISMWVRFLTQTSEGTLFNFGNPTRKNNPYGFKLEKFTVSKTDFLVDNVFDGSNLPIGAFEDSDYARFVRLVVFDPSASTSISDEEGQLLEIYESGVSRDSHFGTLILPRLNPMEFGLAYEYDKKYAFNYTQIPNDFNEWFYIVATFDPQIQEDTSYNFCWTPDAGLIANASNSSHCLEFLEEGKPKNFLLDYDKWYWLNHVTVENRIQGLTASGMPMTQYGKVHVGHTFKGNKCKVEVISKSEMNRALGFQNQ